LTLIWIVVVLLVSGGAIALWGLFCFAMAPATLKLRPEIDPMPALIFEGNPHKLTAAADLGFVEYAGRLTGRQAYRLVVQLPGGNQRVVA